jgi:hypothetical protein
MERLRGQQQLAQNAFVSFTKNGDVVFVHDFGDAQAYLASDHLRDASKRLIQRSVIPSETEYGGWLGQYHRALANPPREVEPKVEPNRAALLGREKQPSRGR